MLSKSRSGSLKESRNIFSCELARRSEAAGESRLMVATGMGRRLLRVCHTMGYVRCFILGSVTWLIASQHILMGSVEAFLPLSPEADI
jgi:uncharacterized membrane protein